MTSHGSRVKFGWLSPVIGNRWSEHVPIAQYQDTEILPTAMPHFDSLWIADHFYGFDAITDPFLEAWTTLTWLAARHPDVMLCHHVLGIGYRPPALLAKMAATLQVLSGNRLILGLGAGWREDEYRAYGYDFPSPAVRFAQLDEAITICRLMWTEDTPSFEGRHFRIDGAAAPPRPTVVPPICIGASGEQIGLPLVGRRADLWNTFIRSENSFRRKLDIVHRSAEAAGRDPSSIEVTTTVERALPTTDEESAKLRDELEAIVALGVQHLVMDFGHPQSTDPVMRFVEQVLQPMRFAS